MRVVAGNFCKFVEMLLLFAIATFHAYLIDLLESVQRLYRSVYRTRRHQSDTNRRVDGGLESLELKPY